ncbi:hypothetical protein D915_008294 [Fasciola hepatica]|uniref:Uncharacterized protein n=1 Tax=Fasciola hepatica TaxID=6192 RepID=A0A4E0R1T6_FASHE|nr:hypothetical protein D915_008294 [Fasciola hepatica]
MNARKESILSCLRSGEQLYHTFLNQSKETYGSMQTSNPLRPTPITVIDHQLDMNSSEAPTSPDSHLSRPTVREDPQTISAERDEYKVIESRHRRNSSRADSSSGHERPSSSSTRCSEIKSDQSVAGSDDLTDDETIDHENKGPGASESGFIVSNSDLSPLSPTPLPSTAHTCSEIKSDQSVAGSDDLTDDETIDHENKGSEAPESRFVVFNSDLSPLSPTPLPSTAQMPSAPVFGSSNEVKRNVIDVITRWCALQQFWCEVCKRLKFQLCAASFASQADAAERWLEVHEADLHLNETGDSIQSTVALIQRHEALEHNLLLQAERFERLKRPTQMELLDTTPADCSVLGKSASGTVVSEETLGMILAVPTVDSMLRQFGLEAEIDSTVNDHADNQEAIVNKSSDEELDSIDQAVYTGRPFNGCLSHCLLHKY